MHFIATIGTYNRGSICSYRRKLSMCHLPSYSGILCHPLFTISLLSVVLYILLPLSTYHQRVSHSSRVSYARGFVSSIPSLPLFPLCPPSYIKDVGKPLSVKTFPHVANLL